MHRPLAGAAALLVSIPLAVFGTIDLGNLPNYAGQPVPAYIQRDNTPPNNPITDAGATLGRVLFYDKRLSVNDTISCASCHRQEHGFSDPAIASQGVNGTTGRHSMRLINTRFGTDPRMFWDERASSVENQATQPIRDHAEMGFSGIDGAPGFEDLVAKMQAIPYYPPLFSAVFGDPAITEERMQRAIAQFVRSIQSFDTKYDAGRAVAPNDGAPFPNFTQAENRGKALFLPPPQFNAQGVRIGGGAGCGGCHRPPEFDIDPASLSNGVLRAIDGGNDRTNTRSPSLRGLSRPDGQLNGPFMHDGSFASLRTVILHYNTIPAAAAAPGNRPFVDPRVLPGGNPQQLQLTDQEVDDIAAFLRTLSGTAVYTDPRWSDPFDAEGNLTILGMPILTTIWAFY